MVANSDGDGRVIAVLGEKIDTLSDQVHELVKLYQVDHTQVVVNTQRLNSLEQLASRPVLHCPQHDRIMDDVINLRLDMARMAVQGGLTGGGVVTVGAGILLAIGKALGWL